MVAGHDQRNLKKRSPRKRLRPLWVKAFPISSGINRTFTCEGKRVSLLEAAYLEPNNRSRNPRFPEVWGILENLRAQSDFGRQNRRSLEYETGVWSSDVGFYPHFRNRLAEVCGKFRNPRARHPFRAKKPQVEALTCSCMVS